MRLKSFIIIFVMVLCGKSFALNEKELVLAAGGTNITDVNKVEEILNSGVKVNRSVIIGESIREWTALLRAISYDNYRWSYSGYLVMDSLEYKKNRDVVFAEQYEAIINNYKIVKLLIENGANVNDQKGDPPIVEAAYSSNMLIMNLLIDNGAKINKTRNGKSAIAYYCMRPDFDMAVVNWLFNKGGKYLNKSKKDMSLEKPIYNGDLERVKFLCQIGVDPNKTADGIPYLFKALELKKANIEIIKFLVEAGAKINKIDYNKLVVKDQNVISYFREVGVSEKKIMKVDKIYNPLINKIFFYCIIVIAGFIVLSVIVGSIMRNPQHYKDELENALRISNFKCSRCGQYVSAGDEKCWYCGAKFRS